MDHLLITFNKMSLFLFNNYYTSGVRMRWPLLILLFNFFAHTVNGLDNGLATLPPMGWLQWARFTCEIDCDKYPDECVNENLFRNISTIIGQEYKQFGYEYVNIDDCWSEKSRDAKTNKLVADAKRFPNGIKSLADFIHGQGLKLGIYGDIGRKTCQYYPGFQDENDPNLFYFKEDAETFASWGIDFLKVDGCYGDVNRYDDLYPDLGDQLNKTGRPIAYSCSWPDYEQDLNMTVDYASIAKHCNLWRNFDDIEFSWASVQSIIDHYAKNQELFSKYNGPGQWFDPDMIIIGNNGLSLQQQKAQLALWSIWSSPLLMSNDLRRITSDEKALLTNRHVIAIDQDQYGLFGQRVYKKNSFEIWMKPCDPLMINNIHHWSYAIVFFNRQTLGSPRIFSRNLTDILLGDQFHWPRQYETIQRKSDDIQFQVLDLFDNGNVIDVLTFTQNLTLRVDVGGAVRMVKLSPEPYGYKKY